MRPFHLAYTGDFLNEDGAVAYGDIGLGLLDAHRHIRRRFITELAPRRDDPDYWKRFYSLEVTAEQLAGVHGLVVLRPWIKRGTIERVAGDLVVIGRSGAGYDKIDVQACTDHGIAVFNTPQPLTHPTASAALLLMLALVKRQPQQERVVREGRWERQAEVMGGELHGRTLGIIGLGNTGQELARLVAPFAMRVLAYSPHADFAQATALGVRLTGLEEILREADFLSLHCRLTAETHGLIGVTQLAFMKPSAYFINVARGELVDQAGLTAALRERRLAGAGLDVFAEEPLAASDPLLQLDNVIITPHWVASTSDVWQGTGRAMAEGMIRAARGEVPDNVVNREVLDRNDFQVKLARFAENRGSHPNA